MAMIETDTVLTLLGQTASPPAPAGGLNAGGIIMMALSITLVMAMLAFCLYRIMRSSNGRDGRN
jgi:hypothetical protein